MGTYYIIIFLVFVFTYIAQSYIVKIADNSANYLIFKKPPMTMLFFAITMLILIFVSGCRYSVGMDFYAYYFNYQEYANDFFQSLLEFNEPGINFIAYLTSFLGGNSSTYIFFCSAITCVLFLTVIYKNTDMLLPATLLYVFLGCWHGAFNGVRQYLAAAIVFLGLRFIKERKFWKYAFVIFIAFLFHSSALLMIFLYFIAYNKISFKNIALLIGASLIVLFSFTEVLEFTGFLLQEDLSDEGEYLTNSVNTFRILVAIAPAVFFLFIYQKRPITKEQRFWFNMLIINAVMMFATSNSTYLARMGIYTAPFSAIGIPELIKGINPKDKKLVTTLFLIAFAAFWLYEISNSDSLNNFRFIWDK